jgi:hypothetical protein
MPYIYRRYGITLPRKGGVMRAMACAAFHGFIHGLTPFSTQLTI